MAAQIDRSLWRSKRARDALNQHAPALERVDLLPSGIKERPFKDVYHIYKGNIRDHAQIMSKNDDEYLKNIRSRLSAPANHARHKSAAKHVIFGQYLPIFEDKTRARRKCRKKFASSVTTFSLTNPPS